MDNTAKSGALATIGSFLLGNIFHLEKTIQADVIFWLQAGSFSISMIVGILTACYYLKKLRAKTDK